MFYRTENGTVSILAETGMAKDIAVPKGQTIKVAENAAGMAAIVTWGEDSTAGILICDPATGKTVWSLDGIFYDCGWLDDATLWSSDGKTIKLHSDQGKKQVELCTYSRVPYGPLDLRASPAGTVLGFLRWQGDHRKPGFVLLDSMEYLKSKHSCHTMSFRNENEAICGHGGAIYNLDIKTDSKKVLLASTAKLLAQKRHQDSLELDNLRSVLNDPTCSVDHLENPVEVDGRIYFSSFVCAANRKCVSLVSTDAHFDDLHVHLQFNQGLVQSIRIAGKGNYVAMRLWPNPLVKEKLAPGWYFLNDGLSGYLEDAEPSNMANPVHKSSLVEYSRR